MTTQDQHTEVTSAGEEFRPPTHAAEPLEPTAAEPATEVPQPESAEPTPAPTVDASGTESLIGGIDLSGLRSRWDDVQAAFVDDPRECVQKADHLVSDVVEQLTTGFAQARSRLEEQWSLGQEASTEELRLALKRYREFFQRLLSV